MYGIWQEQREKVGNLFSHATVVVKIGRLTWLAGNVKLSELQMSTPFIRTTQL